MNDTAVVRKVKRLHITEKSAVLQGLKDSESNPSVKKCKTPKYVFIVDRSATKTEVKRAVELLYAEQKVEVKKVNTIHAGPRKRRFRGRMGQLSGYKKAIVSLAEGQTLGLEG